MNTYIIDLLGSPDPRLTGVSTQDQHGTIEIRGYDEDDAVSRIPAHVILNGVTCNLWLVSDITTKEE